MPSIVLEIVKHHPCYSAHFPSAPVVPGALLLHWIQQLLKTQNVHCLGAKQLKFLQPIKPGQSCELNYNLTGDNLLSIRVSCEGVLSLNGKLNLIK